MTNSYCLMTVGTNRRNLELLETRLGNEGYKVISAASLAEFDAALAAGGDIGLALVDIGGFDHGIWERCQRLRDLDIPLIVISPRQSASISQTSLTSGANAVLVKPLGVAELLAMVHSLVTPPQ